MRLVIAARLSQEAGQTGIDSQDIIARQWAEANGHTVVEMVADRKSGTVPPWKRPPLRPWVEEPEKLVLYDGVLGSVFDRLTRGDNKSTNEIEQWAWSNHKQLLTADGLFFPCEGEDGIRWDLAKRLAHAEWLRISRRYGTMQKHLRDNNWLVGRAPYGYQIVGVECGESPCLCKNDRKTLEVDPDTSAAILRAIDMLRSGKSRQAVAFAFNAEGIPSPGGVMWTQHYLNQVLRNETLIGRRKDKNGKVILRFDGILTMQDWRSLQDLLDSTTRQKGMARKNTAMLAGVIYCAKCKGVMHYRETPRAHTDGSVYTWAGYRCDGKPHDPSKCKVMVTAANIEGWVNRRMTGYPIGPMPVIEVDVTPGHDHKEEIYKVEQEINDLDQDDPEYDRKHADLRLERKRLVEAPDVPPKLDEKVTGETVADRWRRSTPVERRDYLIAAKAKVYVGGKHETDDWELNVERPNVLTRRVAYRLTA